MALLLELDQLPHNASVKDRLDLGVNRASMSYAANLMLAMAAIEDGLGSPKLRELKTFSDSRRRLVYFSDARAKYESEAPAVEDELAWGEIAPKGLQRVSRYVDGRGGMDRAPLFKDTYLQVEAYNDMRNAQDLNFLSPEGLTGIIFGIRVARLEELPELPRNLPN